VIGGHDVLLPWPLLAIVGNLENCSLLEVQLGVVSRKPYCSNAVVARTGNDYFTTFGIVEMLLDCVRSVAIVG